jgi:hypothetical protein
MQRYLVKQKSSIVDALRNNLRWGGPDIEPIGEPEFVDYPMDIGTLPERLTLPLTQQELSILKSMELFDGKYLVPIADLEVAK